jgi:hypothetical protein
MTETTKQQRNTKMLTAESAVGKLRAMKHTERERQKTTVAKAAEDARRKFLEREAATAQSIFVRIDPKDLGDVYKMLAALGIEVKTLDEAPSPSAAPEETAASDYGPLGPPGAVVPTERIERDAGGARRVGPGRG